MIIDNDLEMQKLIKLTIFFFFNIIDFYSVESIKSSNCIKKL